MLPIPSFYSRADADKMFYPHAAQIAKEAIENRNKHKVQPAGNSPHERRLIVVDPQNTFCSLVGGVAELFVKDAPQHMANLAEFIYQHADKIDEIVVTMDTHYYWQIDMPGYFIDRQGQIVTDPAQVTVEAFAKGDFAVNPQMESVNSKGWSYNKLVQRTKEYLQAVRNERGEDHMKWNFHAGVFSIGHAIIPILYDALLYWEIIRGSRVYYHVKGMEEFSQRYSPIRNQVLSLGVAPTVDSVGTIDLEFIKKLLPQKSGHYVNWVAGEASSHCVRYMVEDTAHEFKQLDPSVVASITPLVNCMGPVVIPGGPDFTNLQDDMFRFAQNEGMSLLSTADATNWIGAVS